jgi:hypothetical protein
MQESHCAFNKVHPSLCAADAGGLQGKDVSDRLLILYPQVPEKTS